jgi:hypothetical protein
VARRLAPLRIAWGTVSLVAVAVLSACVEEAHSPLGVTADSVVLSESAVLVDSTALALLSDSAERAAGIYRLVQAT